jgi:hypothetical protein
MLTFLICTIGDQVLAYVKPYPCAAPINRVRAQYDRGLALFTRDSIVPFSWIEIHLLNFRHLFSIPRCSDWSVKDSIRRPQDAGFLVASPDQDDLAGELETRLCLAVSANRQPLWAITCPLSVRAGRTSPLPRSGA